MSSDSDPTLIWSPVAWPLPPVSWAIHVPPPASMRCTAPRRSGKLIAQARTLARTSSPKNRRPKRCGADQRGRLMTVSAISEFGRGLSSPHPNPLPGGEGTLLRRHPQRAVEPDGLAVQHRVLDDVAR